jgi:hypothetical protein
MSEWVGSLWRVLFDSELACMKAYAFLCAVFYCVDTGLLRSQFPIQRAVLRVHCKVVNNIIQTAEI